MQFPAVVKVGGGLLGHDGALDRVLAEIAVISRELPLLVVPGGGPFADAVREADRRMALTESASHWMAVLAMDQYAHLIASRLETGTLVSQADEIRSALDKQLVPVLAPYQWLRDADPLPHSWDVTSDSIAAWVAEQVGAACLVLVKPSGASGAALVDRHFDSVVPGHVRSAIIPADRIAELRTALRARRSETPSFQYGPGGSTPNPQLPTTNRSTYPD